MRMFPISGGRRGSRQATCGRTGQTMGRGHGKRHKKRRLSPFISLRRLKPTAVSRAWRASPAAPASLQRPSREWSSRTCPMTGSMALEARPVDGLGQQDKLMLRVHEIGEQDLPQLGLDRLGDRAFRHHFSGVSGEYPLSSRGTLSKPLFKLRARN